MTDQAASAKKDNVKEYPVMTPEDYPQKMLIWLDRRLDGMEERMTNKNEERDQMIARTARRSVRTQANVRVIWLALLGVFMTIFLTSC